MNGILLVNKPSGMTSHDVVAFLRRTFHIKKIGHTGTLDPNATGLLVCMIGQATKILPFIEKDDKEYQASLKLGILTDTGDIWGKVLEEKAIPSFTQSKIRAVLESFLGQQQQLPPMVSALKYQGKPLYEYARKGIEIERKVREIEIKEIFLTDSTESTISFRVSCSAGTYVRTLCEDIGQKMETVATLCALNRTRAGRLHLKDAYSLEDIEQGNYQLLSIEDVLSNIPIIEYGNSTDIKNGKSIILDQSAELILIKCEEQVLAVYEKNGSQYTCKRGLW